MTEGRGEKARGTLDVTINDSDDVIGAWQRRDRQSSPKVSRAVDRYRPLWLPSGRVSCPSRGLAGAMRA
jgi:hypothetical protein